MNRIREFLTEDPTRLNWTAAAIARQLSCSIGLVHRAKRLFDPSRPQRSYIRRKPLIRGHKAKFSPPPLGEPTEEVVGIIQDPFMSTDDKRRALRALAESPEVRDEAKISAIRTLHHIDESQGKSKELGPGKPLTFEEVVHRLYLLIAAAGPDAAREAVRLAKKEWGINASVEAPKADPAPATSGN
jgi:hypothetical protein